jgi:GTPase SAR1 family protein
MSLKLALFGIVTGGKSSGVAVFVGDIFDEQ